MPEQDQQSGSPVTGQTNYGDAPANNDAARTPSTESSAPPQDATQSTVAQALEAFEGGRFSKQEVTKPVAAPGQGMQQQQLPGMQQQLPSYRKYDGLNAEDRTIFERMSNEAYNKLYPHYLESIKWQQELAALKKEREEITGKHFYEQDNAFQLVPEYQELSSGAQQINAEVAHWQQQLDNIEQGKPWSELIMDDKGQVFVGQPKEVTQETIGRAKAFVTSKLTEGFGYRNQINTQLMSFQDKFKGEHGNYLKSFDQLENKIFAGADQKKLDGAMKEKLKLFPKHMQGRREIKSFAKSLALIDGLLFMLTQKSAAANTQAIKQQTAQANGPTGESIQAPSGNGADTVGSVFDSFDRMKKSGWAMS